MREIIFKAKSVGSGKWVEGYYIHLHKVTFCTIPDSVVSKENDIHQIIYERMTDWNLPNEYYRVDIDPSTLSQSTELRDKDGRLIFENDIIECVSWNEFFSTDGFVFDNLKRRFIVKFHNGCFCLKEIIKLYNEKEVYWSFTNINSPFLQGDYLIIGNEFDNTELLNFDNQQ